MLAIRQKTDQAFKTEFSFISSLLDNHHYRGSLFQTFRKYVVSNKIVFTDRNFANKMHISCVNFEYFQYQYLKPSPTNFPALKAERLVSSTKQFIIVSTRKAQADFGGKSVDYTPVRKLKDSKCFFMCFARELT